MRPPSHATQRRVGRDEEGASPSPGLVVDVARTLSDIRDLEDEWSGLYAAGGTSAAQSFSYTQHAIACCLPREAEPLLLTLRSDGELVAVWPLARRRTLFGSRITFLGTPSFEEYADPLFAPGYEQYAHRLVRELSHMCDLLDVFGVRAGSHVASALQDIGIRRSFGTVQCSVIVPNGASYETWMARKSKSFRSGLSYDERKLKSIFPSEFMKVGSDLADSFVDWFFKTKLLWLAREGMDSPWVRDERSAAFFKACLKDETCDVSAFGLIEGTRWIAGCLCLETNQSIEYFATTFEENYFKYSPGNIMIAKLVKITCDDGRVVDLRFPTYAYKTRWADRFEERESYRVALTYRGLAMLFGAKLGKSIARVKRSVKKLIKKVWRPETSARPNVTASP